MTFSRKDLYEISKFIPTCEGVTYEITGPNGTLIKGKSHLPPETTRELLGKSLIRLNGRKSAQIQETITQRARKLNNQSPATTRRKKEG